MIVQDKKMGEIWICVDLRKLNGASIHDPFPTPFNDEVLECIEGQEIYFRIISPPLVKCILD